MKYIHVKTGQIIDVYSTIKSDAWKALEQKPSKVTVEETKEEKPVKKVAKKSTK